MKKRNRQEIEDYKPAKNQKIDLAQCLEYWASSDPEYVLPPNNGQRLSNSHMLYLQLKKRFDKGEPDTSINLGPSLGAA